MVNPQANGEPSIKMVINNIINTPCKETELFVWTGRLVVQLVEVHAHGMVASDNGHMQQLNIILAGQANIVLSNRE